MASRPSPEFRAEAVRVALTSGLSRKQVAADFGFGFSTPSRWIQQERKNPEKPTARSNLEREVAELRRENRQLREEREVLKKATARQCMFSCTSGEEHRVEIPVNRLCEIMGVSPRGYRAWRRRPLSDSQRKDIVVLAHIREQFALSLGSYGRPGMTEELKELGLDVGHRRVGRLMRQNGVSVKRSKKFKAVTDSNHSFSIASNLLDRDFSADRPNRKWAGAITLRQRPEGCIHHTDRGSQYFSHDYQKILRQHDFKVSMSGKGNCYDNAAVERRVFSRTRGVHTLHLQDHQGRVDLAPFMVDAAGR